MAATPTLSQPELSRKSPLTKTGVLTLSGFGIRVHQYRGHLEIEDGVGLERRRFRLPRVGHGLKRLVIIGNDGFVSLAALRWIADQDAALVMLNRDGSVLATTGPVRSSDARLRRAQALAEHTGAALQIARELISKKLAGQEQVARDKLLDEATATQIAEFRSLVDATNSIQAVRHLEAQGAAAYWAAWENLPITFPKSELVHVPDHWRVFSTRRSPLSGSPRLAADPVNAILNYLYAILEAEASLAASTLGLDPGLGFIHLDAPARDNLACDLMEPVRPRIDAYVLDWITCEPLSRRWFFEQTDGNCRITRELAARLAESARVWGRAVAPYAEWVARTLWKQRPRQASQFTPPTRLTQARKRAAKGHALELREKALPKPGTVCRGCGSSIIPGGTYCKPCSMGRAAERIMEFGDAGRALGRAAAQSQESLKKVSEARLRHAEELAAWDPATLPDWLTEEFYRESIQPRLPAISIAAIHKQLGVSKPYASEIRAGRVPHPRHWQTLAKLTRTHAV